MQHSGSGWRTTLSIGGLQRPLAAPAHAAMKAAFKGEMRADTIVPLWLEKNQIAVWLAQKNRYEKERRRRAKKNGRTSVFIGEDDDDCRDPKKQRIMAHGIEKGRRYPSDEAAEEVAKEPTNSGKGGR